MASTYVLMNQVKILSTNYLQAQQFSLISISLNLVWSFFYFSMLFQITIQGEYLSYLGLPAFWYFICSFTFESRLFILVWRSQLTAAQLYNDTFMRRRLTWYYILFYISSFLLIVFQSWFLYKPLALLTFNCSLWIPQIIKNFRNRSRKVPPTQVVVSMLALQSLLPLYLKLSPNNFLEVSEDYLTGSAMLLIMIA